MRPETSGTDREVAVRITEDGGFAEALEQAEAAAAAMGSGDPEPYANLWAESAVEHRGGLEGRVMNDVDARRAIEAHYATAADHATVAISSEIYSHDAVLEFPQGAERIRGKANIIAFRSAYPARVDFELRRTIGRGELWVNEGVIRYDGVRPTHFVGIMEFRDGKVFRERIYFGDPWEPPAWRARWVEPLT